MTIFIFILTIIFSCTLSYLLGSIPFGLLLTKIAGYGDIRSIGSGNIGATNVLRTGNKFLAFLTLVLDVLKGMAAVVLVMLIFDAGFATIAAPFALIGHIFPVWLKFKGGKGVATMLGILLALHIILGLIVCALWLVTAYFTRYSSLSALVAIGLTPVLASLFFSEAVVLIGHPVFVYVCTLMAVLVFWKHRENIVRLIRRTEPKIGQKT